MVVRYLQELCNSKSGIFGPSRPHGSTLAFGVGSATEETSSLSLTAGTFRFQPTPANGRWRPGTWFEREDEEDGKVGCLSRAWLAGTGAPGAVAAPAVLPAAPVDIAEPTGTVISGPDLRDKFTRVVLVRLRDLSVEAVDWSACDSVGEVVAQLVATVYEIDAAFHAALKRQQN